MKRGLVWGIIVTLLTLACWAEEDPAAAWRGRYRMWFSGDAAWHQNSFEIETFSADEIEGTVEIDLTIGPEQRPPNPDETRHKVKFKARREGDRLAYVSEVLVGAVQPKVYRFEIYPIEAGKSWSGIVSQGNVRAGLLVRRD